MHCIRCGAKIENDARICSSCGQKQDAPFEQISPAAKIPSHMAESVLVTIAFCQPLGLIGVYFACKTNQFKTAGDCGNAKKSSNLADFWWKTSAVIGVLVAVAASVSAVKYFMPIISKAQSMIGQTY